MHVKYILSLSFGLSIHNSVNSWPNHFKFSHGGRLQTNFRLPNYYVIDIFKLEYLRYLLSDRDQTCFGKSRMTVWRWLYFVKNTRRHDVIKLSIADIFLILRSIESQIGHRYQVSPRFYIKYNVTVKVTLTFGVKGKVNAYYFLSLGLSVHNSVNYWPNFFKLSTVVVDKGTSGCGGITSSLYSNWNNSVIYCRIEIKLVLVKAEWLWLLFRWKHILCHFRSSKHDVIKLSIADISLIIRSIESQIGQRDLDSPYNL